MKTELRKPFCRTALAMVAVLLLNGCTTFQRPLTKPEAAKLDTPDARTAIDDGNDASLDIDAGFSSEDIFMLKSTLDSSPLPNVQLQGLSVTESGVYDALRLLLKDTGISLNIEGGSKGSERFGPVAAFDVRGSLTEVLDNLSESIGFFYNFRKNTLFIQQEQQFIVELPPALSEDNASGLTNTLQFLGAKDPYIDRLNRSLVFRTNRPSLAKIATYLQKIRDTRSLIIYDVNIFQVDLRDNSDTGIQWNRLGYSNTAGSAAPPAVAATNPATGQPNPSAATGATTASPTAKSIVGGLTGLGLGLVLSSSRFSIDMLVDFLQTQGNVKAISRPRLAVISGTKGSLRVGQSTTYVSKVGTNFSTSLSQATTETRDLKTGLDLALSGDYSDNTVYTRVGLSISEIVSLTKFTALGTDLVLPTTADREINTVIRARPGDIFLLGGININRDASEAKRGITQNGVSDTVSRSELVLAIKAKVVNFRGKEYQAAKIRENSAQPSPVTLQTQPTQPTQQVKPIQSVPPVQALPQQRLPIQQTQEVQRPERAQDVADVPGVLSAIQPPEAVSSAVVTSDVVTSAVVTSAVVTSTAITPTTIEPEPITPELPSAAPPTIVLAELSPAKDTPLRLLLTLEITSFNRPLMVAQAAVK